MDISCYKSSITGMNFHTEIIDECLIIVCIPNKDIHLTNFEEGLQEIKKLFKFVKERRLKYGVIFDNRNCDNFPIPQIYKLLVYFGTKQKFFTKHLHGTAVIFKNELTKNILDTVFGMYTPVRPIKSFTDCDYDRVKEWICLNKNEYSIDKKS